MKLASHGPRGAHARWDRETGNLPLRSGFPEEMVHLSGQLSNLREEVRRLFDQRSSL
jgi:hypothetical protein